MNTFTKTCGHFGKPLCILLLLFLTNCRKDKNDPTANYPVLGKVELSEIKATSAKMACSITKVGVGADANSTIKEYGICYGTKEKPTIDDTKIKAGEKVDKPIEFSVVGSNLTAGSKFYVRGYVLHEGEPVYSEEAILTTANLKVPDVSTGSSENIISSAFSILGKITDIGTSDVSQHGHVLSESNQVPTTADAKIELGAANSAKDFKSGFAGLKANTTYYVRAYATNATGTGYGTVATVKTANEVPPTVTTGAVSNVSQSQVTVAGKLTDNGTQAVFQTGHCISEANQEPTIADSKTELGSGSAPKDFVTTFLGLNPNKTYYVRAYARSSVGASYGAVVSFKTPNVEPPTVTTTDGTDMTVSSFNAAGRVTAIGTADVTQYGHLISETNQNPTTADKNAQTQMGSTNAPKDFKSAFTNLKSNTTYYLRAYATNAVGTAYSDTKNVKTANEVPPTVTTGGATYNVTINSLSIDGSITNLGTKPVTEYGHCYNKTGNPSIADTRTNKGTTNQNTNFTSDPKSLESNTTYFIRAYAKSDAGVGYGDVRQFKTLDSQPPTVETVSISNTYYKGNNTFENLFIDVVGIQKAPGTTPVTDRGFVVGTTTEPTLQNSNLQYRNLPINNQDFRVSVPVRDLKRDNFIRAYATNSLGTSYATGINFRYDFPPVITVTSNKCGLNFSVGKYEQGLVPIRIRIVFKKSTNDPYPVTFTKELSSIEQFAYLGATLKNYVRTVSYTFDPSGNSSNAGWVKTENTASKFDIYFSYPKYEIYVDLAAKDFVGVSSNYVPCDVPVK